MHVATPYPAAFPIFHPFFFLLPEHLYPICLAPSVFLSIYFEMGGTFPRHFGVLMDPSFGLAL